MLKDKLKIISKTVWTLSAAVVVAVIMTGCTFGSLWGNKDDNNNSEKTSLIDSLSGVHFYLTTGFSGNIIAKTQDVKLKDTQARLITDCIKNKYTAILSKNIWNVDVDGTTFSEYFADDVKELIVRLVMSCQMAREHSIELTESEKKDAYERASQFLSENEWTSYILPEDAEELFAMLALSDKLFNELTKNVNTQISVDEARVIRVQYIYAREPKKTLEKAVSELEEGNDFLVIAQRYSDADEYTADIGRGEMEQVFEDAAFSLSSGETSDIIACDNGYYLVRCVDDNLKEYAEIKKNSIIQERKQEKYNEFFNEFAKDSFVEFDTRQWEKIVK